MQLKFNITITPIIANHLAMFDHSKLHDAVSVASNNRIVISLDGQQISADLSNAVKTDIAYGVTAYGWGNPADHMSSHIVAMDPHEQYILKSAANFADGPVLLDSNTLIPAVFLPSYVDDVIEVETFKVLPEVGENGKIYVTTNSIDIDDVTHYANTQYRWSGSKYTELIASPGSSDNVPEGVMNLYYSDNRVMSFSDGRYSLLGHTHNYEPLFGFSNYINQAVKTTSSPSFASIHSNGNSSLAAIYGYTNNLTISSKFESGAVSIWNNNFTTELARFISGGSYFITGNVGIGTTTAPEKLTLGAGGSFQLGSRTSATFKGMLTVDDNMGFRMLAVPNGDNITTALTRPHIAFAAAGFIGVNGMTLGQSTFRWSKFYSANITDDGTNVGVGVGTPVYKLDLLGTTNLAMFMSTTSGFGFRIKDVSGGTEIFGTRDLRIGSGNGVYFDSNYNCFKGLSNYYPNDYINIVDFNTGALNGKFTLGGTATSGTFYWGGKVGINTTAPTAPLEITQTVDGGECLRLNGTGTGAGGYVTIYMSDLNGGRYTNISSSHGTSYRVGGNLLATFVGETFNLYGGVSIPKNRLGFGQTLSMGYNVTDAKWYFASYDQATKYLTYVPASDRWGFGTGNSAPIAAFDFKAPVTTDAMYIRASNGYQVIKFLDLSNSVRAWVGNPTGGDFEFKNFTANSNLLLTTTGTGIVISNTLFKASGYQSSDGSEGATVNIPMGDLVFEFKNGLITGTPDFTGYYTGDLYDKNGDAFHVINGMITSVN